MIFYQRSSVGRVELRGPSRIAFPWESSQLNLYRAFGYHYRDSSHLWGGVPTNK